MKMLLLSALIAILFWGCGRNEDTNDSNQTAVHDPLYVYAWHLHTPDSDFMQAFGIDPNAHVHLENTWQFHRADGVTIAIIDDYFDPGHPDIKDNVILTYNAKTGTSDVRLPQDIALPHGQFCAGTAAASSNAIGIVGVAPEAKLILIGSAYDSDADTIRAFEFAKTHGADVISCSWGSYQVTTAVADEIHSLYDANITIVFAAGNDNIDLDSQGYDDESELPWVIGVTASSEYNDRAAYANYGSAIDVLAPGGQLIGIPTTDQSGERGDSPNNSISSKLLGADYAFFRGTSAATPIVAGAAALLKSADSTLSPDKIRTILTNTADKIGTEPYDEAGFAPRHAYGKINISRALEGMADHREH